MLHLRSPVLVFFTTPIVVRSEESDPCINELTHDKTFRRIQCDLTEIPTDVPGDVRQVFLEANRIRTLPSEAFSHLSRCTLLFMGKYIIIYLTVPYSWLSVPYDLPLHSTFPWWMYPTIFHNILFLGRYISCLALDLLVHPPICLVSRQSRKERTYLNFMSLLTRENPDRN